MVAESIVSAKKVSPFLRKVVRASYFLPISFYIL